MVNKSKIKQLIDAKIVEELTKWESEVTLLSLSESGLPGIRQKDVDKLKEAIKERVEKYKV